MFNILGPRYSKDTRDQHIFYLKGRTSSEFLDTIKKELLVDSENVSQLICDRFPGMTEVEQIPNSAHVPSGEICTHIGVTDFEEAIDHILDPEYFDFKRNTHILRNIPPGDVHRMQRYDRWIGDTYTADLVVKALAHAGVELCPGQVFYDYGCSSGSLLRVLAWAYPQLQFIGTDPVERSIAWAKEFLTFPNLEFRDQSQRPPLSNIDRGSVDFCTAISIFSHHGYHASRRWFDEIYKVLKPGGVFLFTTHGPGSILFYNQWEMQAAWRLYRLGQHLAETGFVFEEPWLGRDDSGNDGTKLDWGNSYFARPVVEELLQDKFEIAYFGQRLNQSNQDLYIVRKT